MNRNSKFQKIIPKENINTAIPLTLLRSLGKWVQRQLITGIAPKQKQDSGIISQNMAKAHLLNQKLMQNGEIVKTTALILTAVL